ncbi:uncharacterized protein LOC117112961 isoform X3 [Anneissia japonica]|uniref:uncharacterized protein LOC117112961 isoform X3 n=1 Tax=Anneissia japonica TaxID=1529436 RepID=UPI0014256571|nr:uncharacterized protein LOC117112961 isoform X3 [Anneissia japonica]
MDCRQLIGILLIVIISLMNKAIAVSREACKGQPNALWDTKDQKCRNCLHCPSGTGYTGALPCGNGIEGEKGECRPCEEGQFQSEKHSQLRCASCKKCVNRVVIRNCSHELLDSYDTVCGDCIQGYGSLSENSTCVPCHTLRGQEVQGCQADQPTTTEMKSVTSSDSVPLSNIIEGFAVEDPTPTDGLNTSTLSISHYWWTFSVALAIVVIALGVFVCYDKTRKKYPPSPLATSELSHVELGDEETENDKSGSGGLDTTVNTLVRTCADGSPDIRCRETTPFMAANTENEANPSRTSSGYISYDESEFPRDTGLRRRYEQAVQACKDERYNRRVSECDIDMLQKLSIELNPRCPLGTKNWKQLGCYLKVPNKVVSNYEKLEDPLANVLQHADALEALTLAAFLPKLKQVENHAALNIVVEYILKELRLDQETNRDEKETAF